MIWLIDVVTLWRIYLSRRSKVFSILDDEASDCSNQEQLSLVIRFVNGSGTMREELLGSLRFNLGLSWKTLAETVLNGIANLALDIHIFGGQGYDEASSVSGYINGVYANYLYKWESYIHLLLQASAKRGHCCILQYSDC